MAEGKIYLTVDRKKRSDGKFMAVLSNGHPQLGDENVRVLSVTTVKNKKEAKAWHKEMIQTKPWETRQ